MGISIGSEEFVWTLNPAKFLRDHPVEKEAWKNNARKIGVIAIWAGMLAAGYSTFGVFQSIAADTIVSIIAGFMGNVVTHGLYNTLLQGAQLVRNRRANGNRAAAPTNGNGSAKVRYPDKRTGMNEDAKRKIVGWITGQEATISPRSALWGWRCLFSASRATRAADRAFT